MKYRTLGKTGIEVSVVGLGAWQFGGEWGIEYTQAEADAVLDAAMEAGITLIDTAECYGDHLSERFIGNYLKRRGGRENIVLSSKFGHKYHGRFDRTTHLEPKEVEAQLDESLRALNTEYLDIYHFHSFGMAEFETPGLWEYLRSEVERGRVRHLAISFAHSKSVEAQAKQASDVGASVVQLIYNWLNRLAEEIFFPHVKEQNLGVLARVPLASGYLSGKYKPGAAFEKEDVRSNHNPYNRDKDLEVVERLALTEVPEGVPMAQWALAWCLKNDLVSAVIPGCKNPEQVFSNAKAADLL